MTLSHAIKQSFAGAHQSAMTTLHNVAATILDRLANGQTDDAIRFADAQRLSPLAIGFVAACLYKQGIDEKYIDTILKVD